MRTHIIPSAAFDDLASGGGSLSGTLRAGQRSKRLLLVDHLLRRVAETGLPGPATEAARARVLLADLHRHAPAGVEAVLLQPHVGTWAAQSLRQVTTGGQLVPLARAYLGALVASAAKRAGAAADVVAEVGDGTLMFPTYGLLQLRGMPGRCLIRTRPEAVGIELTTHSGRAVVPEAPAGATWWPLRHLHSSVDGLNLGVQLDDLDPYRGGSGLVPSGRLQPAVVEAWQATFNVAWAQLARHHRQAAEAIAGGVTVIVPLDAPDGDELSATCHDAVGAVGMTRPPTALAAALALVHELQHSKLAALLDLVRLTSGRELLCYAPWRADPRPVLSLLHGAYAHTALAGFWSQCRAGAGHSWAIPPRRPDLEVALLCRQVGLALRAARSSGDLTAEGERLVAGMGRTVKALRRPAPPGVRRLVQLLCTDHAAGWRLRNLRTDPADVDRWAGAWLAGASACGGAPRRVLRDGGGTNPAGRRAVLVRELVDDHVAPPRQADRADLLLVCGDAQPAADAYEQRLADAPSDLSAWAGLAAAHRTLGRQGEHALARRPEDVYALHKAIRFRSGTAPAPSRLAAWLGGVGR